MRLTNAQAALQNTLNSVCPEWATTLTGAATWGTDTIGYSQTPQMQPTFTYAESMVRPMKDREKYLLVNRDTAAIVSRHEDESDAASEGARRAAKDGGVYLIFKAIKKVQPKPVDVESVDLA